MDEMHEKLLRLELQVTKMNDCAPRLLNCMKFGTEFNSEKSEVALIRAKQLVEIRSSVDTFMATSTQFDGLLDEVKRLAYGNKQYFDIMMADYGIAEEEVARYLPQVDCDDDYDENDDDNEQVACSDEDSSMTNDGDTLEIRKQNLTAFRKFNETNHGSRVLDCGTPL